LGEIRKIQQVGHSTLVVTIPKKWADELYLKAGQQVSLERETDGSIRILTEGVRKRNKPTFIINADMFNTPDMLVRALTGVYLSGRNTIRVFSKKGLKPHHLEQVRCVAQNLTGLGIIEQTANEVIIHDILDPTKFPLENLIRHMFKIISFMQEILWNILEKFDHSLGGEITNLESEIDRVYWLTTRQLLLVVRDNTVGDKIGISSLSDAVGYTMIVKCLEEIADHYENFGKTLSNAIGKGLRRNNRNLKDVKRCFKQIHKMTDTVLQILLTSDILRANDLINDIEVVLNEIGETSKSLLEERKEEEHVVEINLMLQIFNEVARQNRNIVETVINQYMNKQQEIGEPAQPEAHQRLVKA
jgi:phosphate uptake regulator